jgi:RDD family
MSGLPAASAGEAPAGTSLIDLRYVGLATRAVSFVVDAALITLVNILVGIGAALILAVLHVPSQLKTILAVIGAAAYILGSILYFVIFWCTTGQTPGARMLQIRVVSGRRRPGQAAVGGGAEHRRPAGGAATVRRVRADPVRSPASGVSGLARAHGGGGGPGTVDRRGQPGEEAGDTRGLAATTAGDATVTRVLIRFG